MQKMQEKQQKDQDLIQKCLNHKKTHFAKNVDHIDVVCAKGKHDNNC